MLKKVFGKNPKIAFATIPFPAIVIAASLWFTIVASGASLGQVSDSEINQLVREAAANRQTAFSPASNDIDFLDLLVKGGIFMIPIGLVSLVVVTFVVDRWIGLRWGRMFPGSLKRNLSQLLRKGELDPREVYRVCGESSSAAAKIYSTMVLKTGRPMPEVQAATAETTQREADRAYSNVRWLNLAAGIAPLLGLLGTVWGLILAFHDSTQLAVGQNRAETLAVGIYEALVTTLAGLIVAIPATVASHYFEGKVTRIFGSIDEMGAELMTQLERFEGRTRFEAIGRELAAINIAEGIHASAQSHVSAVPPPAVRPSLAKAEMRPRT